MMHGREKSDLAIVAVKSLNKPGNRGGGDGAKGGGQGDCGPALHVRTQSRESVSQTPVRITEKVARLRRHYPRWEPDAGKLHVRFCAGGAG
jgi:hypothetical protein